jgi:hypothetical protein
MLAAPAAQHQDVRLTLELDLEVVLAAGPEPAR